MNLELVIVYKLSFTVCILPRRLIMSQFILENKKKVPPRYDMETRQL